MFAAFFVEYTFVDTQRSATPGGKEKNTTPLPENN
jgi:hypothetical protein